MNKQWKKLHSELLRKLTISGINLEKEKQNKNTIQLKALWYKFKTNDEYQLKVILIALIFLSVYIGSLLGQIIMVGKGNMLRVYVNPFTVLYVWLSRLNITIIPTLVIYGCLFYGYFYFKKLFFRDYIEDKERKIKIAKSNTYGSAHWMDEEEKNTYLLMSKKKEEITENILGIDKEKRIVARKPIRFTNRNVINIAPPGGGKSVCTVNVNILQNIMRGDSFVCIDTKGAVYRDTAYAAKAAGYNVKIFNTKPDEVSYSDALDILKRIKTDYSLEGKALAKGATAAFVNGLMINLKPDAKKNEIWYTGAINLLKSLILIVKYDEEIPLEERTIKQVYKIVVECNRWDLLEARYSYVDDNPKHPAYESWRVYIGCPDVVKTSILGGLATDLSFLSDERIAEICSHDEIDLEAPGFQKCAYYIVIDDSNKVNSMLAAMFIDDCCNALKNAADKQLGDEAALPVSVNFEVDEAANIGIIPGLPEKMSTLRARGVNFFLYYQDISQIQTQYPGEQWRTIITDASTLLVIKVGNDSSGNGTAKFVEDRLGPQTVIVDNSRQKRKKTEVVKVRDDYDGTQGMGTRPLMYASEIQGQGKSGLRDDQLIAILNGAPPIILQKFNWWEHPLYHALNLSDPKKKLYTYKHNPKWAKEYFAEENQERAAKQAMGMSVKTPNIKRTVPEKRSIGLRTIQLASDAEKPLKNNVAKTQKEKQKRQDEQPLILSIEEGEKKKKVYEKKSNKL